MPFWIHFYQTQAPQEFHTELTEYLTHLGHYVSLGSHCGRASAEAQAKVSNIYSLPYLFHLMIIAVHPSKRYAVIDNETQGGEGGGGSSA